MRVGNEIKKQQSLFILISQLIITTWLKYLKHVKEHKHYFKYRNRVRKTFTTG